MNNWNYICPVCGEHIQENYSVEEIAEYVGATHDCPNCGGLLRIQEDLSCYDFGKELVESYAALGIDTSIEEAAGCYVVM